MWRNNNKFQEIENYGSTSQLQRTKEKGISVFCYHILRRILKSSSVISENWKQLNFNRGPHMHIWLWIVKSNWENWTKQIKISCGWRNNFFKSIILDGLSEYCHKILCWNSHLDTTKYHDTILEKIIKFSIERVSCTVLYEYQRVNSIIYLKISSVSRRLSDTHIMICVSLWKMALTRPSLESAMQGWMFNTGSSSENSECHHCFAALFGIFGRNLC